MSSLNIVGVRVKRSYVSFLLISIIFWSGNATAQDIEKLSMVSGQTELLRNISVDRISIGDPNVVDIEVLDESSELLIQALSPGFTDLRLWKDGVVKTLVINVGSPAANQNFEMVKMALSSVDGITIRPMGDSVLVDGTIYNDADLAKIILVAEAFDNILVLATKSTIDLQNIVALDVKFVEVRKNVLQSVGINWDDFANGFTYGTVRSFVTNDVFSIDPGITAPLTNQLSTDLSFNTFGIASRVNSVIDMLASNGYARLLAEPKLTCLSGADCAFLAGGEVPIPIETEDRINVEFKEYGVILNIQPIADSVGNISATVEVEVSSIDPAVSVRGIPGFLTRKTSTHTNVRNGETIILSGMVQNESSKDIDRVPGLGNIPIIGELFKSRQFRNNSSELLVFVTPTLIQPNSKVNQDAFERAKGLYSKDDENYKFNLLD